MSRAAALETNLRLYPWLHIGRNALFWLPVFVLYFSSLLSPAEVLRLEAIYYAGVVVLEVPSGVLSDRVGRRPTLLIGTVAWVAGSAILAVGGGFAWMAVGQLFLATGMAFQSGTDSSFLYDTLVGLGRSTELGVREAAAQSRGFATLAATALIGGAAASIDLRLGHALSAVVGSVAVVAAWRMVEPPSGDRSPRPRGQIRGIRDHASDPVLRWTFAHAVGLTVVVHVPYEVLQPWLSLLSGPNAGTQTPILAGIVVAVAMGLAAGFGPRGPRLAAGLGPATTLLVVWALMIAVVAAMAVGVHPALIPLVALRSVPTALSGPVLASLIHPRLPSGVRATWLSLQSLAGRLSFALALWGASMILPAAEAWSMTTIRMLLVPTVVGGGLFGLAMWLAAPRSDGSDPVG